jgi:hypothetical protein
MRVLGFAAVMLVAAPAAADTFGGFSAIDAPYLINQDRVCQPLEVKAGAATGSPSCTTMPTDQVANLSVKPGELQHGANADFSATASSRTLTIANATGSAVVTWTAPDPIGKIVDVYATKYGDRVAVAYTTRSFGKEVTQVVAFVLVKTTGKGAPAPTGPTTTTGPTAAPPPEDPKITKAADAARKATGGKALGAWQGVLALDALHSEAQFRIAALRASTKQTADAVAMLQTLAKSARPDAVEWLVEARFDPAFATVRADPKYRDAVGLDRPPGTTYERLMGLGGQWLQNGTQCDAGEVHFTVKRDRTFKIDFKSSCGGHTDDQSFKGIWAIEGAGIKLILPTHGKAGAEDEAACVFEVQGQTQDKEDALRCALGKDLDFVVLPVRR